MSIAATAAEIAPLPERDRRADLVRLSDRLLEAVEEVNLAAYPVPPAQPVEGGRRAPRMPAGLVEAVNQLLVEVELQPRWLRTTAEGLDAIWAVQRPLFGQPDDEEEEDRACGS